MGARLRWRSARWALGQMPQPTPDEAPRTPDLDLPEATDEVLLLPAARSPREAGEEVLQEAAAQAQLVAAGGQRDTGHGGHGHHSSGARLLSEARAAGKADPSRVDPGARGEPCP